MVQWWTTPTATLIVRSSAFLAIAGIICQELFVERTSANVLTDRFLALVILMTKPPVSLAISATI